MDSVRCLDQASQGEGTAGGLPQHPWASAWWGAEVGEERGVGGEEGKREEGREGGRGQGRGSVLSCLLLASESELQLKS